MKSSIWHTALAACWGDGTGSVPPDIELGERVTSLGLPKPLGSSGSGARSRAVVTLPMTRSLLGSHAGPRWLLLAPPGRRHSASPRCETSHKSTTCPEHPASLGTLGGAGSPLTACPGFPARLLLSPLLSLLSPRPCSTSRAVLQILWEQSEGEKGEPWV